MSNSFGFLRILILAALLGTLGATVACGGESGTPEPTAPLPRYDATQILDDYESNEARANETYKGERFIISGQIDKVEDDGVEFYLGEFVFVSATARFKDKEQLLQLDAGQQISLACEGDGFTLDILLNFKDCSIP